jgi:hypothetical protein
MAIESIPFSFIRRYLSLTGNLLDDICRQPAKRQVFSPGSGHLHAALQAAKNQTMCAA